MAVADFDNDGDLDLAISVSGGHPELLRNDGGNANNWLVPATANLKVEVTREAAA